MNSFMLFGYFTNPAGQPFVLERHSTYPSFQENVARAYRAFSDVAGENDLRFIRIYSWRDVSPRWSDAGLSSGYVALPYEANLTLWETAIKASATRPARQFEAPAFDALEGFEELAAISLARKSLAVAAE